MELKLDLSNVDEQFQIPFCEYIIGRIQQAITQEYNYQKAVHLEEYINNNKLIKWQYNANKYISVYDIYRLYALNLKIHKETGAKFIIAINQNENIPDSYTSISSMIALLEYGTLSVRKYGFISSLFSKIADNIDVYYRMFKVGEDK